MAFGACRRRSALNIKIQYSMLVAEMLTHPQSGIQRAVNARQRPVFEQPSPVHSFPYEKQNEFELSSNTIRTTNGILRDLDARVTPHDHYLLTFPSFAVPSVVLPFTPILHVLSHDPPLSDSLTPLSNFYRATEESLWLGCRVAGSGSG